MSQKWWVEMNRKNSIRALDPTGAQGQGSKFKPAGWGGLHPGREEWGPGQVAGQGPGNLDTRMCTQMGVGGRDDGYMTIFSV